MKLLSGIVGLTLTSVIALATSANAADIYRSEGGGMKDGPVFIAQSWTGFYIGVNAGYGFSNDEDVRTTGQVAANVATVNSGARPGRVELEPEGFVGGGQIGYNYQMNRFVLGVEADIAYTDLEDRTRIVTSVGGLVRNNDFRTSLEYLGTVRGRIGYVFDRTLIYATGGFAYGEVENSARFFGPAPAGVLQFTGKRDGVETGYTVGGGFEHAFSPNWSFKAEYLYYDLGEQTVRVNLIPGSGGVGTGYNSKFDNSGSVVRAGINYKLTPTYQPLN